MESKLENLQKQVCFLSDPGYFKICSVSCQEAIIGTNAVL